MKKFPLFMFSVNVRNYLTLLHTLFMILIFLLSYFTSHRTTVVIIHQIKEYFFFAFFYGLCGRTMVLFISFYFFSVPFFSSPQCLLLWKCLRKITRKAVFKKGTQIFILKHFLLFVIIITTRLLSYQEKQQEWKT